MNFNQIFNLLIVLFFVYLLVRLLIVPLRRLRRTVERALLGWRPPAG